MGGNEHQSSAGGIFDQLIVPYDRVQLGIAQVFFAMCVTRN